MQEMLEQIQQKIQCVSGYQLKIFAIIIMTIDHAGYILFPQYFVMRKIGRLAFPIFAFLIVEGMVYTRDAKKYLMRLGAFALISEIPFDYAFHSSYWYIDSQNVFFTLFIGAACIYILQHEANVYLRMGGVLVLGYLAEFLCTDYGMLGVYMILALFVIRGNLLYVLAVLVVFNVLLFDGIQEYAIWAIIPIALYNGTKGKGNQAFCYVYYPMHLLILGSLLELWY